MDFKLIGIFFVGILGSCEIFCSKRSILTVPPQSIQMERSSNKNSMREEKQGDSCSDCCLDSAKVGFFAGASLLMSAGCYFRFDAYNQLRHCRVDSYQENLDNYAYCVYSAAGFSLGYLGCQAIQWGRKAIRIFKN